MTTADVHATLLGFAAGTVTPEEFESALFSDASPLAAMLSAHSTFDFRARERTTPYRQLLDLDILANPERAREIVRTYVGEADIRPVIDDQLVARIERVLGVKLPSSYVQFVATMDPDILGYEFPLRDEAPEELAYYLGDGSWEIDALWGLSEDAGASGVLSSSALCKEWGLPAGLVLIHGDGHTFLALDYRGAKEEPSVIFIESNEGRFHVLAPTFAEFAARLRPRDDEDEDDDGE